MLLIEAVEFPRPLRFSVPVCPAQVRPVHQDHHHAVITYFAAFPFAPGFFFIDRFFFRLAAFFTLVLTGSGCCGTSRSGEAAGCVSVTAISRGASELGGPISLFFLFPRAGFGPSGTASRLFAAAIHFGGLPLRLPPPPASRSRTPIASVIWSRWDRSSASSFVKSMMSASQKLSTGVR
jgi:hypothetical protein